MSGQSNVEKLMRQTKRYEFVDGLRDIQLGLVMLSFGIIIWLLFDWVEAWFPALIEFKRRVDDGAAWLLILLVLLVPALIAIFALPLMRRVRERWLWRDSGMIRPKRWLVPRQVSFISTLIVLIGLAFGVVLQIAGVSGDFILLRMLFVASGWSLAYTLVAMGRVLDLPRYVKAGIVGGLVSTLLPPLPLTVGQTGLVWGVSWFVILIASGSGPFQAALHTEQETDRNG